MTHTQTAKYVKVIFSGNIFEQLKVEGWIRIDQWLNSKSLTDTNLSSFQVFFTDHSGRVTSNLLLDQLPSYQSLLYRRKSSTNGTKRRGSSRTRTGSSGSAKWANTINRVEEKQKSQMEQRPIRELPKTMAEKRTYKWDKRFFLQCFIHVSPRHACNS